jgi:hypothetical protein
MCTWEGFPHLSCRLVMFLCGQSVAPHRAHPFVLFFSVSAFASRWWNHSRDCRATCTLPATAPPLLLMAPAGPLSGLFCPPLSLHLDSCSEAFWRPLLLLLTLSPSLIASWLFPSIASSPAWCGCHGTPEPLSVAVTECLELGTLFERDYFAHSSGASRSWCWHLSALEDGWWECVRERPRGKTGNQRQEGPCSFFTTTEPFSTEPVYSCRTQFTQTDLYGSIADGGDPIT